MKKILFLLAALSICGSAAAQHEGRSVRAEKQPSKFVFGVSYRFSLGIVEHASVKIPGFPKQYDSAVPDDMKGGAFLLSLGCNVTDNWNVAMEFGIARYAGGDGTIPIYARAQYFYGRKTNRWFNYANLGAMVADDTGLLAGVGGGYRVKLGRRTYVDFTVGYELWRVDAKSYGMVRTDGARTDLSDPGEGWQWVSADLVAVRHGLTFGVGFAF